MTRAIDSHLAPGNRRESATLAPHHFGWAVHGQVGAITLNRLTIVYGDGTNDVIPVGAKVDAGNSYGPIQLKPKAVREIVVSYRSRLLDAKAAGKGYAFVEFWAQ